MSRCYLPFRRGLATLDWDCECGCQPVGPDIDTVRKCLLSMADEIEALRAEVEFLRTG